MSKKESAALKSFRSGNNCAQAVLSTFTEDLEVDNNLALQISSGFGGGMGRLQETCGAATGAFMVLGLYNSQKDIKDEDRKEEIINMIQSFSLKFETLHGSMDCKTILKCDLKTAAGQQYMKENKLSERLCEKCVQNAVSILEELLEHK